MSLLYEARRDMQAARAMMNSLKRDSREWSRAREDYLGFIAQVEDLLQRRRRPRPPLPALLRRQAE